MKAPTFSRRAAALMATAGLVWCVPHSAAALSMALHSPQIHFPPKYDEQRAEQLEAVLRAEDLKFLGGLTSHWEPEWGTILVYDGDAASLNGLLAKLNAVAGITVKLTFSPDLSKETGSALQAGSWWVTYSHTEPDTITVRINLAAERLKGDQLKLILPKAGMEK